MSGGFLRFAALVLVLVSVAFALDATEPPPSGAPNVLLVSIDTLRADHLHAYGYARETSPTIDRLAAEGALFETVLAPSSWTLPSHITLLTAMPPREHGVRKQRQRLRGEAKSLAEVFRDEGYDTAGFVAGPFLSSSHGFDQGFDVYDESTVSEGGLGASHRGRTSPRLVTLVTDWLRSWRREPERKPFFVFLHMWDPHYDFNPPPPYDTLFDPDYEGTITGDDFELGKTIHREMNPRDLEHVIALYDGEIRYTDDHLGEIIAFLDRIGQLDDTIVVVTSDHGEEFFEHGHKGHAKALFDESLRVPFVVRHPRSVAAGRRLGGVVRLMDVAPTVLGLAGVTAPDDFGSRLGPVHADRDLSPWLTGAEVSTPFPRLRAYGDHGLYPAAMSVRSDTRKLIKTKGQTMVFDVEADPAEQNDLGDADPEARALVDQNEARTRQLRRASSLAEKVELTDTERDRLRALGYIR